MMPICSLFGYPLHASGPKEALACCTLRIQSGETTHVVTLNPEMLMQGDANPALGNALREADVVIPDGVGVVWAVNRYQSDVVFRRAPGIELSEGLIQYAADNNLPVAFIGAAPEIHEAAMIQLKERFPSLNIVYHHHGFFDDAAHEAQVARDCISSQPAIVFVALGVPKQELWIREWRSSFTSSITLVGVGGSFDVWSGLKNRAPWLFCKLNLEWLYRITSEPWRLQRVMKTLPPFFFRVLQTSAEEALSVTLVQKNNN